MVLRVTEVQPLEGYRLRITFNDGAVRDVDFAEGLERVGGTLAEPLRDPAYFRQVRVDEQLRTIVWPNGLDADPDGRGHLKWPQCGRLKWPHFRPTGS